MRPSPSKRRPRLGREWPKHAIIWAVMLIELFPLYMMLQVSAKDNTGFLENAWLPSPPSTWLWENWRHGIRLIAPYIANTLIVATSATLGTTVLALLAAYFFARYRMPCSGLLWSVFIALMLMPSVANIVPLFSLIKSMHLLNTLTALVLVGIAGAQVFNIFVLRNFMEDLPKDLFDAAEMDGAGHFQQLRHVVVPLSMPILGTLSILSFIRHWNEFLLPLIIIRDQELFTLGVGLIYLDGEYVKQWGQIMAAYFVASVPLIAIFLFAMRLFVRGLSQGAIKG